MTTKTLIGQFVRDITAVGSLMTKSQARGRIEVIIASANEDFRRKIIRELNKATTYDHKNCPIPQTCIGYGNCMSDIENGVPSLKQFTL